MSAPGGKKPPNLAAELRRDAVRGKVPNMPRTMYRGTLNALLDKCDWTTGRNAFVSKATISKGWSGGSDRKIKYDLRHLEAGGWIEKQWIKNTDGRTVYAPDGEPARLAYYGDETEEHPGIRADRRPPIYRVNFQVFYAEPRPVTGGKICPASLDATGGKNDPPTGGNFGQHGGHRMPPTLLLPSDPSDPSVVPVFFEDSPTTSTPPPHAGGSDSDADPDPAPDRDELRRTVKAALTILDLPLAVLSTDVSWRMIDALETITARGTCCLECALLVPYWVANWAEDGHDILAGMNQRLNLTYLWGRDWGNHMARATQDAHPRSGLRESFETKIADLSLYSDERFPDTDDGAAMSVAIREACRWCVKRKKTITPRVTR